MSYLRLGLSLLVFMIASSSVAQAGGSKPVRMKFAGGLILNLEQQVVNSMGLPTGATALSGIALTKSIGNLGWADTTVVTRTGPPMGMVACPDGLVEIASITDNSILLTFLDLSLLFGDGIGAICAERVDAPPQLVRIKGNWSGGTKRFRDAQGTFQIRIDTLIPVSFNTQFTAETGIIRGTLNRP